MQDRFAQVMRSVRHFHGALEPRDHRTRSGAERNGQVVDLRLERKNRAQELIEDFMIAANGIAAQFLEKRGCAGAAACRALAGTVGSNS